MQASLKTARHDKGFTLVELLVVISIIALLLAILMPALGKAKKQGQTIVCGAHVKQWGLAWMMYAQDYNGKFFEGMLAAGEDTLDDWWFSKLWPYAKSEQMRFCPVAKKYNSQSTQYIGGTFEAWGPFEFSTDGQRTGKMAWSSYGVNLWVQNPPASYKVVYTYKTRNNWRTINVSGADKIPLMLDAAFSGAYSSNISEKPENAPLEKGAYNFTHSASINTFCIDRHLGKVNTLFLDFSVRPVGLKSLWSLKWHRYYDTAERRNWPTWMGNYK